MQWKLKREKGKMTSKSHGHIWAWKQIHAKSHPKAQEKVNRCGYEKMFMKQIWVEWSSRESVPASKVHPSERPKILSWETRIYENRIVLEAISLSLQILFGIYLNTMLTGWNLKLKCRCAQICFKSTAISKGISRDLSGIWIKSFT